MVARHREGMTNPLGAAYEIWRDPAADWDARAVGGTDRVE
jgi:hypothetical protein